jgi:SOS-response transcriptional repressor LexA
MNSSIGETLSELRRAKKLMQKDVAAKLSGYGFRVSSKTIYNWEKGLSLPGLPQFLALCEILGVDDVLWQFAGIHNGPYAGLNEAGRKKARELIDLLFHIEMYREGKVAPGARDDSSEAPRLLRLYDIPVSAGAGNFLDDSGYEMIEAPGYIPAAADFALRLSGDSMEPLLQDGQIIWVKEQEALNSGDIGIFIYFDDVYCKKLIANGGKACLRSLNPSYEDIEIKEDFGFKTIGKVV